MHFKDENCNPRKSHRNTPSFSSTLLDEIYRSIDGNTEQTPSPRDGHVPAKARSTSIEDLDLANFTRARLVEKWMGKDIKSHAVPIRRSSVLPEWEINSNFQDTHLLFFSSSSNSNSSSSDSSGALSNSDTEFLGSRTKPAVSCFSSRPKPVRITRQVNHPPVECKFQSQNQRNNKLEDDSTKSRSTALKLYDSLKKMKQPISPGGKLTSFINSLFSNGSGKKKSKNQNRGGLQDLQSEPSSTCSVSRSCRSRYYSREKMRDGDQQRTVRFHAVGVSVDQHSKPCGHKSIIYSQGCRRPPLPPNTKAAQNGYQIQRKNEFSTSRKIRQQWQKEEEEDAVSESSSDLFEIDHLAMFGLPGHETSYFDQKLGVVG